MAGRDSHPACEGGGGVVGGAACDPRGAQLPTSAVSPEANGEKAAAADLIAYLPTIRRRNSGHNAAAGKIFPNGDPGSIWGGIHFSVSLLRNPRKTK